MEVLWLKFNTEQSFTITSGSEDLYTKADQLGTEKTSFFAIETKVRALIWLQEFLRENPHLLLVDRLWEEIDLDELHELTEHLFVIEKDQETEVNRLLLSLLLIGKS